MNHRRFNALAASIAAAIVLLALCFAPVFADDSVRVEITEMLNPPQQIADYGELADYQIYLEDLLGFSGEKPVNIAMQYETGSFVQNANRGQIAEYQADLVKGALPAAGTLVFVEAMNEPQIWGQVADLGELEEYKLGLYDFPAPAAELVACIRMAEKHERFDQIANLGELADYKMELQGGAPLTEDTLHDVFVKIDRPTYEAMLVQ